MKKTELNVLRTSPSSCVLWLSDSFRSFIFSVKSNLVLTILGAAFLLVHLLEVQYNAFEDKDNMLFILFKCFMLDIKPYYNKLHELYIGINLARGDRNLSMYIKSQKAKSPTFCNYWQV